MDKLNDLRKGHLGYEFSFGVINVYIAIIWLGIIVYRLVLIHFRYKQVSKSCNLNADSKSNLLYNLSTLRTRDFILFVMIIFEVLSLFVTAVVCSYIEKHIAYSYKIRAIVYPYFNCTVLSIIGYSYIYPANMLCFILLAMLIITQFMLISFLNVYIAGRYFGHSLHYKVRYKFICCWIFQCVIQLILIIPWLQIFFPLITSLLLLYNWSNLVASSRKVKEAIRSKMEEVRLFEWNPTHYRNYTNTLKYYKLAMLFVVINYSLLIISYIISFLFVYIQLILVGNCYFEKVYGISFTTNFTERETYNLNNAFTYIYDTVPFIIMIFFGLFFTLPSVVFFVYYLANYVYGRCTSKVNINKITGSLVEPLISKNSTIDTI